MTIARVGWCAGDGPLDDDAKETNRGTVVAWSSRASRIKPTSWLWLCVVVFLGSRLVHRLIYVTSFGVSKHSLGGQAMYVAFLGREKSSLPASSRVGEGRRCMLRLIYVAFFAAGIVARGRGHEIYVSFLVGRNHRAAVAGTILTVQNHCVGAWFRTLGNLRTLVSFRSSDDDSYR